MYKWITCILIVFNLSAFSENNNWSVAEVDSVSYSLYSSQKWEKLCQYGEQAIFKNIDFYYLRYRLGIAYYELQKYRAAIPHFEKAYEQNYFDEALKEYLYYSYLFSGEYERATKTANTFNADGLNRIGEPKILSLFAVDAGSKNSDKSDLIGNLPFMSAAIGHRLGKGLSMFESYSYLSQTVYYGYIYQNQYYVSCTIPLSNQVTIQPAVQLLDYHLRSCNEAVPSVNGSSYLGGLKIKKSSNITDLYITNTLSDFNNKTQYQHTVGLILYPLMNQKFSVDISGSLHTEDTYQTINSMYQLKLNLQTGPRFDVHASYLSCNAYNTNEADGFLVNNSVDLLKYKINILCNFKVYKSFSVYALYQYETRHENYLDIDYHFNTLMAGLKLTM